MEIISHRGYWLAPEEKNSAEAFHRSFSLGFGTETDIRDLSGKLVVSHDIPYDGVMSIDELFEIYLSYNSRPTLALNIKSDGLQNSLAAKLQEYQIENYFVFDMSIPDTLGYLKKGMKTFLRYSEYEDPSSLLSEGHGIWLDGFKNLNLDPEKFSTWVNSKKIISIVSPELHKRDQLPEWKKIKEYIASLKGEFILCTDTPEKADEYFNFE